MDGIRQWAFSVCAAMVACGLARTLLPQAGMEKIFRVTVSIFFLCCLLSPVLLRAPALRLEITAASQEEIAERARRLEAAVDERTEHQARWEVAKIVGEKLAQMGIKYYDVTINMNSDGQSGGGIESVEITLDTAHEPDHREIHSRLQAELGLTVRLGYRSSPTGE